MRVWDIASDARGMTGKEVRKLKGHAGAVNSVAWHPDGTRLASASSDGTVKLWNTGEDQEDLVGVGRCVAWSPNQKLLASSKEKGGALKVFQADNLEGVITLPFEGDDGVWSVAFSPNDRYLAAAIGDGTIVAWEVATWQKVL